jgi:superfamily II DNA/RNA helicase
MDKPLLIDMVGTNTNQIPDKIKHKAFIVQSDTQKYDLIKEYVQTYPEKKVMIFTETKLEAKAFGKLNYGRFVPIHGDLD